MSSSIKNDSVESTMKVDNAKVPTIMEHGPRTYIHQVYRARHGARNPPPPLSSNQAIVQRPKDVAAPRRESFPAADIRAATIELKIPKGRRRERSNALTEQGAAIEAFDLQTSSAEMKDAPSVIEPSNTQSTAVSDSSMSSAVCAADSTSQSISSLGGASHVSLLERRRRPRIAAIVAPLNTSSAPRLGDKPNLSDQNSSADE
ncbi:hypothetical protein IWX49DRAFT_552276 [Phyllosticta citricarpa]|uniref:Uncharacterized protein n=1 Tax=Phyllosticta citricarpa TaxID=55181 RepID=A0ABR1MI54_9PEZI